MNPEAAAILNIVEANISRRAALAKIDTSVLCGDLRAWVNRSLGQSQRQAIARVRRHQAEFAHG